MATVLMYLSTPEEGGETVFPYAEKKVGLCAHVCVCMVRGWGQRCQVIGVQSRGRLQLEH